MTDQQWLVEIKECGGHEHSLTCISSSPNCLPAWGPAQHRETQMSPFCEKRNIFIYLPFRHKAEMMMAMMMVKEMTL